MREEPECLLDRSCQGECHERQLRVIPLQLPGDGLVRFVSRCGDPSVLAEARGDDYRRFVFEEAIHLPVVRSILYPFAVTAYQEGVELFEIVKVELNDLFVPVKT
jgi:hypothetical protein